MWPRVLPFGLYMAFLTLESLPDSASAWVPFLAESRALLSLWLYPTDLPLKKALEFQVLSNISASYMDRA